MCKLLLITLPVIIKVGLFWLILEICRCPLAGIRWWHLEILETWALPTRQDTTGEQGHFFLGLRHNLPFYVTSRDHCIWKSQGKYSNPSIWHQQSTSVSHSDNIFPHSVVWCEQNLKLLTCICWICVAMPPDWIIAWTRSGNVVLLKSPVCVPYRGAQKRWHTTPWKISA